MKHIKILIIITLFLTATPVLGAETGTIYKTLAPIGNFIGPSFEISNLSSYLNNMFKLGIALAGALAVIQIIIGGMKYVTSATMGQKGDGKAKIEAAIMGLVVVLGAYALLNTIDSRLLRTDALNKYGPVTTNTLNPLDPCPEGTSAMLNSGGMMAAVGDVFNSQSVNPATDPSIFEKKPCLKVGEFSAAGLGDNNLGGDSTSIDPSNIPIEQSRGGKPSNIKKVAVIIHKTEGSYEGSKKTLLGGPNSVHFIIGRNNGEITQLLANLTDSGQHVKGTCCSNPTRGNTSMAGKSSNQYSIGIEFVADDPSDPKDRARCKLEGKSGGDNGASCSGGNYTQWQVDQGARLIASLANNPSTNFKLDPSNILTHNDAYCKEDFYTLRDAIIKKLGLNDPHPGPAPKNCDQ